MSFEHYAQAFIHSSERTRRVFFLIVAFTVLSVIAFINTAPFGWNKQRLATVGEAYYKLSQNESARDQFRKEVLTEGAQGYMTRSHVASFKQLEMRLASLEAARAKTQTIELPIFGVAFESNDLGLIAGVSLLSLAILLRFCLQRECKNLRTAFEKAEESNLLIEAYKYLATAEVLHVPPKLSESSRSRKNRLDVPTALVFLAPLSYAMVTAFDIATFDVGKSLSQGYASFIIVVEIVALIVLVWLAYSSCKVLLNTRAVWDEYRAKLS